MSGSKFAAAILFAVFAVLYIATMCPTVYTMDNGELIVAAAKLRIAHPTGYPLFCLLGKVFSVLIPYGAIAWRINAMNAIFAAASVGILYLALAEIARRRSALFTAAIMGLSPVIWDAAGSADVHGLTALLVSAELYFFLRWWRTGQDRMLCYLALSAGLTAANHMSSVLILPGIAYGVLRKKPELLRNPKSLGKCIIFFLLPLSLYAYLPIRAAASAGSIWGDIYAGAGFMAHVTGKAFRTRMFSLPLVGVWKNLIQALRLILTEFPIWIAWALPVGGVLIHKTRTHLTAALLIAMALNITYAVNYAIPDIEPYYIPTFFILAVLCAVGLDYALEAALRVKRMRMEFVTSAIMMIAVADLFAQGVLRFDKHDAYFISAYADNAFKTADKGALLVACGDSTYGAMVYAREIEGRRPDLIIVERNILRAWIPDTPTWTARYYYKNVSKPSPVMRKFGMAENYSFQDIKSEKLLADIISAIMDERPVFITCTGNENFGHPILKRLQLHYRLEPEGMMFRVVPKSEPFDPAATARRSENLWASYDLRRITDGSITGGLLEREIPERYAAFRTALGDVELRAKLFKEAEQSYRWAITADNKIIRAKNGLAVALVCQGRYAEAADEWRSVLEEDPNNKIALRGLKLVQSAKPQPKQPASRSR